MRNPFLPGIGGVLSADIAVPEHDREVRFYSRVLTTGSAPFWRDDLMNNEGTPVIGLGARIPEYESLPLQWMPHFQVADVATSAKRTVELGGTELMHGKDADGQSQWAVLVDLVGAAFGVIPIVGESPKEKEPSRGVGRIAGLTLIAPDAPTLARFYESVVGWSAESGGGDTGFEMRRPDGVIAAEIRSADRDGSAVPPVWIIGLPVGDLAESLRLVTEEGGDVLAGSCAAGRAVVRDPVGVCLALQIDE